MVVRCSGVSLTFRTFAFGGLCAVQIAIQLSRFSAGVSPLISPFVYRWTKHIRWSSPEMVVSDGRTACWQYGQNILAVGEDGGQSTIALTWDNSFFTNQIYA